MNSRKTLAVAPMRGRRRAAGAVTIGLPLLTLVATAEFIDLPVLGHHGGSTERRAALAIRDHVHPVEKLGTWSFVLPRLESSYGDVRHFTQGPATGFVNNDQREQCIAALTELLEQHDDVDLFLLAHTNSYVRWIEEIPPELRVKIRLVYNSGCWSGRQAQEWLDLGAASYVAHPSAASHIGFFVPFFRRWTAGVGLTEAVITSNERADKVYGRLSMLGGRLEEEFENWCQSRAKAWGHTDIDIKSSR